MESSPTYSIAGKRLFSSQSDFESQIPDADTRQIFAEIVTIVNNLDNFNFVSKLDYLLKLNLKNLSSENLSRVQAFLKNTQQTESCIPSSNANHIFNWNDLEDANMDTQLSKKILTQMQIDIEALDAPSVNPLSYGTNLDLYRTVIKNLCKSIWEHMYTTLQPQLPNEMNKVSTDKLKSMADKLCEFVTDNASRDKYYFNKTCSENLDTYFENVYKIVLNQNKFVDKDLTNVYVLKSYIFAFYPYFLFEFILNNVATKLVNSVENAPRFFFLQRIAVLASYMFLFYSVTTIEESMEMTSLQTQYQESLQIMAKINDEIFAREKLSYNSDLGYTDLHQATNTSKDMSLQIQQKNLEIAGAKNNLTKAAIANALFKPKVKYSKVVLYVWVSVLILVTIISALLIYVFKMPDMLYIFAILVLIALMISWITTLIKQMNQ